MPLSAAVRERCRAFLPDGEQLRYVFPATSLWTGRAAMIADFIVAVTDSQVTVLGCSWFRRNRPSSVWATYPRGFRLGPVELYGSLSPTVTIGPLLLEVDEEYVPVIRAADAEITNLVPLDPLPDL
ncbi:hypothetical protein [Actinocrispum sp. NPDC049592]|uniref:hypothetical protein n=1 Tax=Actinocrispum sp. NPDC049592 TaxID=3154835 RepID=UPI0034275B49